ncbi:MAG TPA: FG-GAP-like repeat-containing protein [Kofleriaceae bacterium]|nr:FG-GAP-like repeat-containing protein [Kofleriaceae bacterium]
MNAPRTSKLIAVGLVPAAAAVGIYLWAGRRADHQRTATAVHRAAAAGNGAGTGSAAGSATAPGAPRVLATLPEFVLEDQGGASVDLYDLHGQVWIADFVFTRCDGTCPLITKAMAELQGQLAADPATKDVRLVSFTVDPDHDTPQVLTDYAKANGADPARWTFLTGGRAAIRGLVTGGFKLPVAEQDDPRMPIMHSQNFVLVDKMGRVRGTWDALAADGKQDLKAALAKVVAEPDPRHAPTGGDLFVPPDLETPSWLSRREEAQRATADSIGVPHDFTYSDRVGASGITFRHVSASDIGRWYRAAHYDHGTALAAADVDGDGRPDLYFVNQVGPSALYRNLGDDRFEDITAQAGVAIGDRTTVGAAFADVDNDGDADLLVTSVRAGNLLFLNDGHGRFTDVTAQSGIGGNKGHGSGAVFFDYDDDGLVDLFVANVGKYTTEQKRADGVWAAPKDAFAGHLHPERFEQSQLFHNLGGGHFEDASAATGLVHSAWSGEATPFDYDEDGHTDLYVLSMQGHDELWRNKGDGHFEKVSRKVFPATPWGAMGTKVLDWNGDGHLDLYVTDMHTDMATELLPDDEKKKHDPGQMFPLRFLATDGNHVLGNALFTARGAGGRAFDERSDEANVETGWPWGPSAGDLNADGWPDLFVAAGMNFPFRYRGNDVLLNQRGRRFADAAYVLGIEPRKRIDRPWFTLDCDGADAGAALCAGAIAPAAGDEAEQEAVRPRPAARRGQFTVWAARGSRSAVILDLDGDGDLDIVTNDFDDVPQVFVSDLAQRAPAHHVSVRLVGKKANRGGLGATVTVVAGGRSQLQANDGKSGYLAQSVLPLYFGLGDADHADLVRVRWPGGGVQEVRGPFASGTEIKVEQP